MKLLCTCAEYLPDLKQYKFIFITPEPGETWITGEFRVLGDKPNIYTPGEWYECKINLKKPS